MKLVSRRVCAMDVGTNSTRMMIADLDSSGAIRVITQDGKITRLGKGIAPNSPLDPVRAAHTLDALVQFVAHARSLNATAFRIYGTAALRESCDSEDFCRRVEKKTGFPLTVIEGHKEAQLAEAAIAQSLDLQNKKFCAMDIGGGSAEWIRHCPGSPSLHLSLPLGAVRLTEQFLKNDPPEAAQIKALEAHVCAMLQSHVGETTCGEQCVLVGTGGTATTLAAMTQQLTTYNHEKIHGSTVDRAQWGASIELLRKTPCEKRASIAGLQKGREDIILAGLIVLKEMADCAGAKKITVSDRGLLYGMLVECSRDQLFWKQFNATI